MYAYILICRIQNLRLIVKPCGERAPEHWHRLLHLFRHSALKFSNPANVSPGVHFWGDSDETKCALCFLAM